MKACRVCGRLYPDDAGFCQADGQELRSATQVPVPSQDADPRVGTLLCGRYQIFRVVADGGMGRVYEALDKTEKRSVAVKILHADVARDEISVERFKREFETSKSLPHAHIVEVLDFQRTEEDSYALVTEFLYGEELRATLKRSRVIEPARLVRILSQLAIGLDEAHARNLVHRDVKPDNIFLCQTSDGDIAKLLDFGSVKDRANKPLTALGTTIGTPFYMSPEQAQGLDTLDQRADVWALATIVYECVTGSVPFQGVNAPSILLDILNKEPVVATVAASGQKYRVPVALDGALARAMKKTPSLRTRTVGALADSIGHAYGLDGAHRQWATTSQAELGARIQARLDSADPGAPEPPAGQSARRAATASETAQGRPEGRLGLAPWWFFSVLVLLALVVGIALSLGR